MNLSVGYFLRSCPRILRSPHNISFFFNLSVSRGSFVYGSKWNPEDHRYYQPSPFGQHKAFNWNIPDTAPTESKKLHQWIWAKIYLSFFPHVFYCLWPHKCWFYHVLSPPWWFGTRILSISYIKVSNLPVAFAMGNQGDFTQGQLTDSPAPRPSDRRNCTLPTRDPWQTVDEDCPLPLNSPAKLCGNP